MNSVFAKLPKPKFKPDRMKARLQEISHILQLKDLFNSNIDSNHLKQDRFLNNECNCKYGSSSEKFVLKVVLYYFISKADFLIETSSI